MTQLARKLRITDYFSLGWGTMGGVGWLVVMDDWLTRGGPLGGILGFAIGGVLLLPIGYVYGKLVMAMPDASGEVAYTASVFPQPVSFFTGWMMMLAYFIVCPWEAVAVGRIAGYIFPALDSIELYRVAGKPVYLPHLAIGLGLTGLLTLLNYRGIRLSATFQNWTTFGTLALFVVFVGIGVTRGSTSNFPPLFTHTPFISILLVLQIVPYFMTGYESVTKAAEEANPEFRSRSFLRAIWAAIIVGFLFYIIVIAAVGFVAPWHELDRRSLHDRGRIRACNRLALDRQHHSGFSASLPVQGVQRKLRSRQPLAVCDGKARFGGRSFGKSPSEKSDARNSSALGRFRYGRVHVPRQRDPHPDNRRRLPRLCDRMVCCLRRLSANESPAARTHNRVAGCVRGARYGADEDFAFRSWPLFWMGMACARFLVSHWNSHRPPSRFTTCQQRKCSGELGETFMTIARRITLLFLVAVSSLTFAADRPFDLVIIKGHIVDGTGSPWYSGDIGIRDGRIAAIGNLSESGRKRTIDAAGKVIAPGFIDMLGQSETTILVDPRLPSKIFQGITTEVTGEGGSIAPLNDAIIEADLPGYEHYKIKPDWRTFRQYFVRLEKQGIGINLASYVGATQVRRMVLGDADVQPTAEQLEKMKALVRDAMREGAVGVSTSLEYAPAPYAKTEEIIALAGEAAKFGGIYATHMRSESDSILESIDESLRIGREAHIPVEIWHIKVAGKNNWGRMPDVIAKINQARAQGADISANTYAYTAWFNSMSAFIPPWAHDGGDLKLIERLKDPSTRARIRKDMTTPSKDWDNEWDEISGPQDIMIGVVQNAELKKFQGKRLSDVAQAWNKDPMDALFDLLIEDKAFTSCAVFGMSEPDVALALQQPWVSVDNDSSGTSPDGILGEEHPHPRAYGTFPRILRKYVREEKKLTLEDAIRKFAALPAQRMHFNDRGVLKQGMWADVVIFDPETVRDLATFDNPNQLSQGMEFVLVNGVPVIENGKMTGALPGKVLRGAGFTP